MSEHTEQSAFFTFTELFEKQHPELGRFFAIPNGGARHPIVAAKLKHEGVRKGILDVMNLTAVVRGRESYHGLILEFKVGNNTLTPEQRDWKAHFEAQGFRVEVPRSWVEAALITIDYFGLPEALKKQLPLHRVKGHLVVSKEQRYASTGR